MPNLDDLLSSLPGGSGRASPSSRLESVAAFGGNPGGLAMWTYAPDGLPPSPALVVVLHGCGQTAAGFADGAGWLALADRLGFVVLCPEQNRSNNPNLCFNWFRPDDVARGLGEAASIHAMIREATARHGVDPRRVFITGLSAGAAMANALLAAYPETFVAGALIAGLPYGAASSMQEAFTAMNATPSLPGRAWGDRVRAASGHAGPWPRISVWQGDADAVVRPGAADAVAAQWADVHGVESGDASPTVAGRRTTVWRDRDGAPVVELHRIAGMGHGVPLQCAGDEACGRAGPFLLDVGIGSSLEIARGWGLDDRSPARGLHTQPKDALPPPPEPSSPPTPRRGSSVQGSPMRDVQGVISKALRDAGLLR